MRRVLDITKALSDGSRLRALLLLKDGELCVCQIIETLELAPSTVSKHMSILRQAGLVESRKAGQWMYYRLADAPADKTVRGALGWLLTNLADDPALQADHERLRGIEAMDKRTLCEKVYRQTTDCCNKPQKGN